MGALNIVEFRRGDAETGEETINIAPHQRYIYRGYLQVAACDLTRGGHPSLWLITWDPTQPIATRPLSIQKDGTWYCYGWDLTKNICEVFGQAGFIRTTYAYTPYGSVTEEGDVTQPLQWSSEYADPELSLVYYNYRSYNPTDGRWIRRDLIFDFLNLYTFFTPSFEFDILGNWPNSITQEYMKSDKHSQEYMTDFRYYEGYLYAGCNELNDRIRETIKRLDSLIGKNGRRCYEIILVEESLSQEGVENLPWDASRAFLLSHTSYLNDSEFILSVVPKKERRFVQISSNKIDKRVDVVGCHYSGKRKGAISMYEGLKEILKKLQNLENIQNCCSEKPEKIYVVSCPMR